MAPSPSLTTISGFGTEAFAKALRNNKISFSSSSASKIMPCLLIKFLQEKRRPRRNLSRLRANASGERANFGFLRLLWKLEPLWRIRIRQANAPFGLTRNQEGLQTPKPRLDRKSTRLNSSHTV